MRKTMQYLVTMGAVILVLFFSLDIKNLEEYKALEKPTQFDAVRYAANFWNDSLPQCISDAPQITEIFQTITHDPEKAFEKYGRKLGISKSWYFLSKGTGTVENLNAESVAVKLPDGTIVNLATDFIYGNSIRDGSGKVNINEFLNMTDFNAVSVEINKLAKSKVVPRLKSSAFAGATIEFAGAFEINEENPDIDNLLLLPVSVKVSDGKQE